MLRDESGTSTESPYLTGWNDLLKNATGALISKELGGDAQNSGSSKPTVAKGAQTGMALPQYMIIGAVVLTVIAVVVLVKK